MAEEKKEITEVTEVEVHPEDLRGEPREGEEFFVEIKGKQYPLVPATLRNIPKIGSILKEVTAGGDQAEVEILNEDKIGKIAELIHLSLKKEDQEEITVDDILDNCSLATFPLAIRATLSLNDFFLQTQGMNRILGSMGIT